MKNHFGKTLILLLLVLIAGTIFPLVSSAAYDIKEVPPPNSQGPITSGDDIVSLIATIGEWVSIIFWILAVVFILYAGFLYMSAQGSPEKVKKANGQLLYGIIAIVVGLIAYGLPKLVEAILLEGK